MLKTSPDLMPGYIENLAEVLHHSRPWHRRLQHEFELHPAVHAAFKVAQCCDWHRIVLEWPHRSMDDSSMLAYVRSEDKAEPRLNTKTTVGKYIKRHFPAIKDDVLRDLVYKVNSAGCEIVRTTEEIVAGIQNGPESCMQWDQDDIRAYGGGHHPYEVYDPKLGWGHALRKDLDGNIAARALVHDGEKCFVRTYGPAGGGSADPELHEWLKQQGYQKLNSWPNGIEIAVVRSEYHRGGSDGYLFPYIDGNRDQVERDGNTWVIVDSGEYECSSQNGDANEGSGRGEPCPDCGDRTDEDDQAYIDYHQENWVCQGCCDRNYTYVDGRRESYYVPNDEAVEVSGTYYDSNNLPDCIVTLEDGDYCHEDNAVYCEESSEYYHENDRNLIQLEDGRTVHKDYAWQCDSSNEWYAESDVEPVEIDGYTYHPDNVPDDDEAAGGYDKPDGIPAEQLPIVWTPYTPSLGVT
jgi:hypothetical protein